MKLLFLSTFTVALFTSCGQDQSQSRVTTNDTFSNTEESKRRLLIETYTQDERVAYNSIAKYGLEKVNDTCLKYLYVIYAAESIKNDSNSEVKTVGESELRLVEFGAKSENVGTMWYDVFGGDSLPVRPPLKTSMGNMLMGFDVDIQTKQLIRAARSESSTVSINHIRSLCDSAFKSQHFRDYISNYSAKLHPKFKKLISSYLK